MKNIKLLFALLTCMLVISISSCKKDEEIGGTAVQSLSGEWWVQIDDGTGLSADYYKLSTYNTAANTPNEMWIDDSQSFYGLKAKTNTDVSNKTFSVTNADENYFGVKVTITDGKVLTGAATAPGTKNPTDSIYFKAQYSDSPGVTFTYRGYKRTQFSEDDH